ncbi:MAG: DUF255 domain-containing protein [Christiangramia sp.]|nr:DUF255 domain-containing protein [Christiangramia sp.]
MVFFVCSSLSCGNDTEKRKERGEKEYKYTNDLINETSPYLLDHAHNPVNWKPWEDKAFEEATSKDQLVIISIGYSSCHWCHVMEEETFENEEVAEFMNNNFVNIKVDREERPDIDEVYMTAINLIKGNGGWPLNIIALPDGKPIYTGTYHTTEQWKEVLTKVNKSYQENPEKAREYANMIAEGIQQSNYISVEEAPRKLEKDRLIELVNKWAINWDNIWGGDRGDQKFMLPATYEFILDYALLQNDIKAQEHVRNSLEKMRNRGVYDHVGGGFFRYSTDAQWMIPHYEKMLYDNAQLISLYSKAYRAFGNPEYKETVDEVTHFLQSTMKDENGGFYAAIDADSDGEEGKYYTWEKSELNDILGSDYELFSEYYQIQKEGEKGRNVIFKKNPDSEFLKNHSVSEEEL